MKKEIDTVGSMPSGNEEEMEIDLLELFYYLKTKLVYLIAALLAGAIVTGAVTALCITPTYQAMSYLYMVSASSGSVVDLSDLNIGTSVASDYTQLLTRRPVLENVIEKVDKLSVGEEPKEGEIVLADPSNLSDYIELTTVADSHVLSISVITPYPEISKDIANELADQATTFIPKIMDVSAPTVAEYAVTPEDKYAPSLTKNVLIGSLVCLLLMIAFFTVLHLMDDSIADQEDMEKYFGITPLAVIPEGKKEEAQGKSKRHRRKGVE